MCVDCLAIIDSLFFESFIIALSNQTLKNYKCVWQQSKAKPCGLLRFADFFCAHLWCQISNLVAELVGYEKRGGMDMIQCFHSARSLPCSPDYTIHYSWLIFLHRLTQSTLPSQTPHHSNRKILNMPDTYLLKSPQLEYSSVMKRKECVWMYMCVSVFVCVQ